MPFSIILWFTLYSHSSAIFNYYEITGANRWPTGSVKPSPLLVVRNGETFEPAQPIGYTNGTYQFDEDLHEIGYVCQLHNRNLFFKFMKPQKNFFCSEKPTYDAFKYVYSGHFYNIGYGIEGLLHNDNHFYKIILFIIYEGYFAVKYTLRGKYLFDIVNRYALEEPSLPTPFILHRGCQQRFSRTNTPEPRMMKALLAPADDYLTPAERRATYHKHNFAPIWDIMYQKWLNVENFIRKVSYILGELKIIVGVRFQSKIHNVNLTVYTTNHDYDTVPRYYVKAVIHERSKTAILIVFHMTDDGNQKRLCDPDISLENGWFVTNNDDIGSIYACEYNKKSLFPWSYGLPEYYDVLNLHKVQYETVNEAGKITKYDRNVTEEILHNFY